MKPPALLLLLTLPFGLALSLLAPRPTSPLLAGEVRDEQGPLAAALVRSKGTSLATLTDLRGRFLLPGRPRRLTAWKEGYFIAGGRSPRLHLERLPDEDNDDYAWVDPTPDPADEQRCGNCHQHLYREWKQGGHARSATGTYFLDLYEGSDRRGGKAGWGLLAEHPNGAGVCSSCHAPSIRDDDPALFDLGKLTGVAARGVHCDYCHKVAGPSDDEPGLTHGRFALRLLRPHRGQLFFGPLDDVDRGEDSYSAFQRDSRLCAACHEGVVFGVPVYTTYSEWLASPARAAGRHCQHCHLKPTGTLTNIAPGHGGIRREPHTLANHRFWDTSQLDMLRRCLDLAVEAAGDRGQTTVSVRLLAHEVGHRVPTGFIDRQLLLVVQALDPTGAPVPLRQGLTLPAAAGAPLAGQPGRLYARLLKDETGRSPVPFWRALPEPEDTRLVPGQPDRHRFTFAGRAVRVRVRVLHRRFWAEAARAKGWPDQDLLVVDRTWPVRHR